MGDDPATSPEKHALKDVPRLAWRKFVHRNVVLGIWGGRAGDHIAPGGDPGDIVLEIMGPEGFDEVAPTTPYVDDEDLESFREQTTSVIVVRDAGEIVASTWMTSGEVYVHELARSVSVPPGEHFSCRSYVRDDQRGRSLLGRMIHHYAMAQPADDWIWGLVYDWNTASTRTLEKLGWRRSGEMSTRHLFTRKIPGEHREGGAGAGWTKVL